MVKTNQSKTKVYIVQDILDTKLNNGLQFYKVKWKDYTAAQSTWEPEESFNCSKDILNQFLTARAHKEPAFKEKLLKIQRERQILGKQKGKGPSSTLQKKKMIKKLDRKQKTESSSEDEISSKEKNDEDSKQDLDQDQLSEINQGGKIVKGKKTKNAKLEQDSDQQEADSKPNKSSQAEEKASKRSQSKEKLDKRQQGESKGQKFSPIKPSDKSKTLNITLPKNTIEILLIRKENGELKFYVLENNKKVWKTREQVHKNYARQLCEYYEKHLSFDD